MLDNVLKTRLNNVNDEIAIEAIKAGDQMIVRGYASVFGNMDKHQEIVNSAAFSEIPPVEELFFLHEHNWGRPIGKFKTVSSDDRGLFYEAEIDETEVNLFTKIKNGLIKGASFRASILDYRFIKTPGVEHRVRELMKLQLSEISIVTRGANPLAGSAIKNIGREDFLFLAKNLDFNDRKELIKMWNMDPVDKDGLLELTNLVTKFTEIKNEIS